MRNSATAVLRDCEVCRVSRTPTIENAPPPPLLQQQWCVPFPLGRFDARSPNAPPWFALRDCEVCEVFYIPRQKNREKSIYIGWCGAALANLAVPPILHTRVGGPPGLHPLRVIRTALCRQGAGLSHRQPTATQHAPPLADLDFDLEMYEDAIVVSSRFRSLSLDRRIGGSDSSQHGKGEATGILVPAMAWISQRILADEGGAGK